MNVMMNIGGYSFEIATTPYQELSRRTSWMWAEQDRIGLTPSLQFTGKDAEVITLTGMLIPGFTGDRGSLEALRLLADQAKPMPLVSGQGMFFGLWVIQRIEEGQDIHFSDGSPRRMSFTIELKKYADTWDAVPQLGSLARITQIFG